MSEATSFSGELVREALIAFNDRQWRVEAALEEIDFDRLQNELGVALATSRALESIRNGKVNLRREIQQEINFYGQRGVKPDRERVAELMRLIRELNSNIEAMEQAINLTAR